jgi:hypothetical protein
MAYTNKMELTNSLLKAKSFHSNSTKIANVYEMAELSKSVSNFMSEVL